MYPEIQIPASKSISNRLLILQYLFPEIQIKNLSTAEDSLTLYKALKSINTSPGEINIGHAGTAMRFLTALLSIHDGKSFILDGSKRMRQRPIGLLVDALNQLGADISYVSKKGYPPLQITGKTLKKNKIKIPANVSSQYITAMMLIAPKLPDGLIIELTGKQVSTPYIDMTLQILQQAGIKVIKQNSVIKIQPTKNLDPQVFHIEGDWSSASYFYGGLLFSNQPEIVLSSFFKPSIQGDSRVVEYFKKLGIKTVYMPEKQRILLQKIPNFKLPDFIEFDLLHTPDLAQTLAITCLALKIRCKLTGLETLKIKETDRLSALQTEMQKLGADVEISNDSLEITHPEIKTVKTITINTYNDHRMAMSFAILQKKYPVISIADKDVVIKSFPGFWQAFKQI